MSSFKMFKNLSWQKVSGSADPVREAIEQTSKSGDPVGAILKTALEMTGSEGAQIQEALASFSEAYNPILEKLTAAMSDEKTRKQVMEKVLKSYGSIRSSRKRRND